MQKKSVSGSWTLPLQYLTKNALFSNIVILTHLWVKLHKKYPFLKIPDAALKILDYTLQAYFAYDFTCIM